MQKYKPIDSYQLRDCYHLQCLSKLLTESMGLIYQMKFEKLKLIAIFSGLNLFFKV